MVPKPRMSRKWNVSWSWNVIHHLHFSNFAQVLCLHLKRFKFQAFHRSKVDTYVQFPVRGLDMSPYCMKDQVKKSCALESKWCNRQCRCILSQSFGTLAAILLPLRERVEGRGDVFFLSHPSPPSFLSRDETIWQWKFWKDVTGSSPVEALIFSDFFLLIA